MLEQVIVGFNLYSYHLDHNPGLNNNTPGVYIEVKQDICSPTFGVYRNSDRDTSEFLACTFHYGPLRLTAGAVAGYKAGVLPLVYPSIEVPLTKSISAAIGYVPKPPIPDTSGAIHFSIEMKY